MILFGFFENLHTFISVEAHEWKGISIYNQFTSDQIFSKNTGICFFQDWNIKKIFSTLQRKVPICKLNHKW